MSLFEQDLKGYGWHLEEPSLINIRHDLGKPIYLYKVWKTIENIKWEA